MDFLVIHFVSRFSCFAHVYIILMFDTGTKFIEHKHTQQVK